ncbi:uncharacterized protein LOC133298441 [Gastrolobium bilobum]|uniref:uncharacterized protein LOC133298441 n=1 Tax=Gastrolobium bilobum TaxID=150636 RepID=UPI002AB05E1C|nr:uncharacterized protein LOC133298441 [Gastrolobium bilobum]
MGFAGGIWVLWDANLVDVSVLAHNRQFTRVSLKWLHSRSAELAIFVYGCPRRMERKTLWDDLTSITTDVEGAWIVLGDFNAILNENEKNGGNTACPGSISGFRRCINECALIDLGFKGPHFTWRRNNLRERLDRALANQDWKNRLHACIAGLDMELQDHASNALEVLQRNLWGELNAIYLQEEFIWFQRSRCEWMVNGDRNTKFYHATIVSRGRRNKILALKDEEDNWIGEPQALKEMVVGFFEKVYINEGTNIAPFPFFGCFPKITSPSFHQLHAVPSELEIKDVFFSMSPFKAPGPDWLHAIFFQSQWNTIGPSVCNLIKIDFIDPKQLRPFNKALLCLIPKVDDPDSVKKLRPIMGWGGFHLGFSNNTDPEPGSLWKCQGTPKRRKREGRFRGEGGWWSGDMLKAGDGLVLVYEGYEREIEREN